MLVPVPVIELVVVADSLAVEVEESVPESLPVNDGPAPFVTDAVGEREIERDKLFVVEGDVLDVGVPVAVPLPVDVPLVLIVEDIEIESVPLCALDRLAPRVGDDDGGIVNVLDKLAPRVGDDDGVFTMLTEILIVLDNVAIAEGESEPIPTEVVTVPEGDVVSTSDVFKVVVVTETLELAVGETVLEAVGESEPVSALEGVAERVDTALGETLELAPSDSVDVGVADDDGDSEGVGEVVASDVIDVDCDGVKDGVCDEVEVGESLEDCVCVGVKVSELVPDLVKVGVIELLDVIDALAPRVTLVVGVAVFEEVTDALAEAVSLAAREKLACAVESVVTLESILKGGAAETLVLIVDVIESDNLAELLIRSLIDTTFDALPLIVAPIDPGSEALALTLNVMRPLTLML